MMKRKEILGLCMVLLSGWSITTQAQQPDFSEVPGTVIAHSPKDSKIFLGSPSLSKLPSGAYVVSHDTFGPGSTEYESAVSRIYKSVDQGKTWQQVAEINGAFWSKLFVHQNVLYLLGTNKHHGDLVLRKSEDEGSTWTEPTDKLNGLLLEGEYHAAPMAPIYHNGRLWRAVEDASGPDRSVWGPRYGAMMMSIPVDDDLMHAANWTASNFVPYDSTYLDGNFGGWVEGNALVTPDGEVVNILRVQDKASFDEKAAMVRISADGKTATFDPANDFLKFPGGSKKFVIKYDDESKRYWTLSNYIPEHVTAVLDTMTKKVRYATHVRNTLALCSSSDLVNWDVHEIVLHHPDVRHHAFQYADWIIEGNDILFVSRTAYDDGLEGAHNAHNSNMITFHTLKEFRKYVQQRVAISRQ